MKHLLTVLLCLLLLGCTPGADRVPPETVPQPQSTPEKAGMYDPNHPMEQAYPGLVRAYPLAIQDVQGIRAFDADVLILSGEGSTVLTLLTGEDLYEAASLALDFELSQSDPSLRVHENSISFFDPRQQVTFVLDRQLQELRRIQVPQGISGKPILSADAGTLYYCTQWSVVAWDLESGIRRTLKELAYDSQELTGLHGNDRFLECTVVDGETTRKLLLSADNGVEIKALQKDVRLHTGSSGYLALIPDGFQSLMLFGDDTSAPGLLLPETYADQHYYLESDHAAVTVADLPDSICLDYYELSTGILRSSLMLDTHQAPKNIINTRGHAVYILAYDQDAGCHILYRWDVLRQTPDPANTLSYTSPYHSIQDPDLDALEQCREYARQISETYGITVQVWEDACTIQPWDYQFTPEYLAPVLMKELTLLETRLSRYPEGILEKTASHFTGLTICLVRGITGTAESGSLSTATGIQFLEDNHAYVVISTGKYAEQSLYHELYHVMDTHILTESVALDQWESLNPGSFAYSHGYEVPTDSEIYLQGQTRAFVDSYSMSYPKEDRARILEYAMLPGHSEMFQAEYLQRKLIALCQGIREAYGLDKHPEVLPWEQYLVTPLIPNA